MDLIVSVSEFIYLLYKPRDAYRMTEFWQYVNMADVFKSVNWAIILVTKRLQDGVMCIQPSQKWNTLNKSSQQSLKFRKDLYI